MGKDIAGYVEFVHEITERKPFGMQPLATLYAFL